MHKTDYYQHRRVLDQALADAKQAARAMDTAFKQERCGAVTADAISNEVCDLEHELKQIRAKLAAYTRLVNLIASDAGGECDTCRGYGIDLDDLPGYGDDRCDAPSIESRIEAHYYAQSAPPSPCPEPTCWRGQLLGVEIPEDLLAESGGRGDE